MAICRRAAVWAGWTCNAHALLLIDPTRRLHGRGEEAGGRPPAFFILAFLFWGTQARRYDQVASAAGGTQQGEKPMNRTASGVVAISALLLGTLAHADVRLNAARVGGPDVASLAKFYETAFGLQEVNRLNFPGNLEIMLNFGDSVATAKANTAAQIVIMHRAAALKDPVPHLILNVSDLTAAIKEVQSAGGSVAVTPRAAGNTGVMIAIVADPAGNRIELIKPPG
jgi:predicted enzyme related to lactoylglutathione lyase